ncbi:bifunctional glycosyltransferase/CDP-glycerol:glycerophosphate glycerophosphotransferase, partial [Streptomyces hainanensis]|uniref:bifunctional glycosyltransferase/CDP-glycerol:glycerophosphate glycerophosphotransferase n=1 Tax=Streptomyces hainanensis TaxID=402648 RepID=UPI001405107E
MPRFSIIVPAYQVQAQLPACLTSVLTQDFRDVELIVVDDASPDACGEIAAEFAAADPRVTALRLDRNAGPGPARNAGLDRATGDYLLFLDGDDTLTPGALAAVAARLRAAGEPELLVFGHARVSWRGEAAPGDPPGTLSARSPAVTSLAGRADLLRLPPVAWARAYRRDLVARLGLRFPAGHYQDVPFAYPALAGAGSIAVLDRICLHHRERRRGGRARSAGDGHLDVLRQYELAFALLPTDRWRAALYRRMVVHLTAVHRGPGLPAADRAAFLRGCRELCARHRAAAGATAIGGRPGAALPRPRLRARRVYRLLATGRRLALRAHGTLDAGVRAVVARARAIALRAHYLIQLRRPLDPGLAVFTTHDQRYGCHPAAIEAKLRELTSGIATAWVAGPEHPLPQGVRRLLPDTAEHWAALARARYLVGNTAFPTALAARPGQLRLQTHRGTPLAHRGLDTADPELGPLLREIDRWDHSLSANRHTTLAWGTAYPADYTILEYGSPRADLFHTAHAEEVPRARARLGVPEGVRAVLYAPAPRGYRHTPLDTAQLAHELGPGFVLLTQDEHPDVPPERLCLAADALVTDYSPVLFDYAGLDRPIVVHAPDWEAYRAVHGAYLDLPELAPGPVTRTLPELAAALTGDWLWSHPRSAELRAEFRRRFCPYDDGFAAERVVRAFFLGGRLVPPV